MVLLVIAMIIVAIIGIRINNNRKEKVDKEVYTGKWMGTAIKKSLYLNNQEERNEVNNAIDRTIRDLEKQISVRIADSEITT